MLPRSNLKDSLVNWLNAQRVNLLIMRLEREIRRFEATRALSKIGAPAVDPLIQALSHSQVVVRICAAEALVQIGDRKAVQPLIKMLSEPEWKIRAAAARALAQIGDCRAMEPLTEALRDVNPDVRKAAIQAVVQLGDCRAVELLILLLQEGGRGSDEAAKALGALGDRQAVRPLLTYAERYPGVFSLNLVAIEALGEMGDPAVLSVLQRWHEEASTCYAEWEKTGEVHPIDGSPATSYMLPTVQALETAIAGIRRKSGHTATEGN